MKMTLKGTKLVIEVDVDQERGMSSTGKSILITSENGNCIYNGEMIKVGLNVYKPIKKAQ